MSLLSYEDVTKKTSINESVFKSGNVFKVKTIVDVPTSVVNAYIKKIKEVKGPDAMDIFSQTDVAETIVKHILANFVNADNVPVEALVGDVKSEQPSIVPAPVQPIDAPIDVNTTNAQQIQQNAQPLQVSSDLPEGEIQ